MHINTDALLTKGIAPADLCPNAERVNGWVQFPWEHDSAPTDAVVRLLQFVGEDVKRDGLIKTPARVVKALGEMTEGYKQDPAEILSTTFDVAYDEMVVLRNIQFTSMCEHHMLPFIGEATVAYIPGKRVVGLSKLARLVHCFARRLQVQERMTQQIAQAIQEHLTPQGVGVVVSAHHQCMSCRGVRQSGGKMITSTLLGAFRDDPAARAEFLAFVREGVL
jgi:GTP cyclohydrolase I